jgi:hypothetical protein
MLDAEQSRSFLLCKLGVGEAVSITSRKEVSREEFDPVKGGYSLASPARHVCGVPASSLY